MGALEKFITDVRDTKLSGEGVSELSYYPALRALLEEVGDGLKPKVRCFMNLRGTNTLIRATRPGSHAYVACTSR